MKRYNLQVIGGWDRGLLRIDNRDDGSTYTVELGTWNVWRHSARGKAPRAVAGHTNIFLQIVELAKKEFASK